MCLEFHSGRVKNKNIVMKPEIFMMMQGNTKVIMSWKANSLLWWSSSLLLLLLLSLLLIMSLLWCRGAHWQAPLHTSPDVLLVWAGKEGCWCPPGPPLHQQAACCHAVQVGPMWLHERAKLFIYYSNHVTAWVSWNITGQKRYKTEASNSSPQALLRTELWTLCWLK